MQGGDYVATGRSPRCALAVLALLLAPAGAPTANAAETYPSHPIRLLVGFGAGGPTDIPARFIADKLSDALGQRVVVENKPAAGGIMATRDLIAQPPDGYTLLSARISIRSMSRSIATPDTR